MVKLKLNMKGKGCGQVLDHTVRCFHGFLAVGHCLMFVRYHNDAWMNILKQYV